MAKLVAASQKAKALRVDSFWTERFQFINSTWAVALRYDVSVLTEAEVERFLVRCAEFSKWVLSES